MIDPCPLFRSTSCNSGWTRLALPGSCSRIKLVPDIFSAVCLDLWLALQNYQTSPHKAVQFWYFGLSNEGTLLLPKNHHLLFWDFLWLLLNKLQERITKNQGAIYCRLSKLHDVKNWHYYSCLCRKKSKTKTYCVNVVFQSKLLSTQLILLIASIPFWILRFFEHS